MLRKRLPTSLKPVTDAGEGKVADAAIAPRLATAPISTPASQCLITLRQMVSCESRPLRLPSDL